jgi:FtsP/CotA-like multicopper oxidase with cupredoxin domain
MRRVRLLAAGVATAAILAPVGWWWQGSLLPDNYSMMETGFLDTGGGRAHEHHGGGRPVSSLVAAASRPADVSMTLVARRDGDRYTLNGTTPGPEIRARTGDLVQVRLVNESVPEGVTLHWHGVDVPNAADGVAGVTQDAVRPGGEYVYRFVADRAGTYWYHSHQVSHQQVIGGLFGALVVNGGPSDVVALVHLYDGRQTVNGRPAQQVPARPGAKVRVRIVNTDNGPMYAWTTSPFRLLAVDGTDVHGPSLVTGQAVQVTAGGRADLEVTAPARIQLGRAVALLVGGDPGPMAKPKSTLDMLTYGIAQPLGLGPFTRDFRYDIGRRIGFLNGRPGYWWTVNGHRYPDLPMFAVDAGDVVRLRIRNHSGEGHPMHLHGHHVVVLSRDGRPATGSPWWVDSLDVADDQSYEVAFVADNPGIWSDHCHNLPHAAEGLIVHLMYSGVTTPYRLGSSSGNEPE